MLDPVVGGYSERKRKLRQAISIAIDYEQYILIFLNGRGVPAQGPLPPGIIGHRPGCAGRNEYVYDCVDENLQRKPIEIARRLLAQAGYPDGRDVQSGKSLLLYFDTPATGPQEKANIDWMRKQFQKLNIQLEPRATDYNRFQEKMRKGDAQIFRWGWNADYPDPENFLFLLYSPNKKVGNNGENASNYESPEFDRLFERMKNMNDSPERARLIDRMLKIARRDAPWVWGLHPKRFTLHNAWVYNVAANNMANNTLKYIRLDPALRTAKRQEWNQPIVWPVTVLGIILALGVVPAVVVYVRKERQVQR
jgi:ABC-type transport system substrate-binding protein